jgi:hypothetical protein
MSMFTSMPVSMHMHITQGHIQVFIGMDIVTDKDADTDTDIEVDINVTV